ncbi:MAG: GNAT family N-acetyltransferase [Eubacteriales bacterium]|nr:GNAT family N-acetyltransferase [Eubacteriales bacterium]
MEVRKTREEDLPIVMEIYSHARTFMAEHGNPRQWGATNWPPETLIRRDIQNGNSYVCSKDGEIAAVFYYDHGKNAEPGYLDIEEGSWKGDDCYGVVHRIASAGTVKGAGAFGILWAYEQSGSLRMDTHPDNKVMQNLLTKLGFVYRGIIHVEEDNDPRFAYEKLPESAKTKEKA